MGIKKATVKIRFETASGYESDAGSQNQPGTTALEWGIREIARIMTIDGKSEQALALVNEAIATVKADLAA